MIEAVIFDMDGLMIDSEPIQSQSFETVLKEYGREPICDDQGIVQIVGVSARDNWSLLKKRYGIEEDIQILIEKKRAAYISLLRKGVVPMPGLSSLLDHLRDHQVKKAIGSSSSKEHIDLVVTQLNLQRDFDVLVSGEQIKRGKPAPDIFLEIASQLHVSPTDCIVLEDAFSGVEAGKNAGMKVIAVPNRFTARHDFTRADKVVLSLQHVNWGMISSM